MSPLEQRMAIARACGWTDVVAGAGRRYPMGCFPGESFLGRVALPDYLNDLNAMAEAEKSLFGISISLGAIYRKELCKNAHGPFSPWMTEEAAMCHATAAQRAKAFLKAKGLWKEGA